MRLLPPNRSGKWRNLFKIIIVIIIIIKQTFRVEMQKTAGRSTVGWLLNLPSLPKSHIGVPSIPVTDGCVSNLVFKNNP